ncbi:hypothetical protein KFE94_07635 [bacterium SCSIO 12643]|nr:hypothetical protein KFE94_07635 [bacterium SCSIO 12643]
MIVSTKEKVQEISLRYENFKSGFPHKDLEAFIKIEVEEGNAGLLFLRTYLCENHGFSSREAAKLLAKFSINRLLD